MENIRSVFWHAVGESGIVCRSGGDEFLIIAGRDEEDTMRIHIKNLCQSFNETSGEDFLISMSIGQASIRQADYDHFAQYYKQADDMLYIDKRNRPENVIRTSSSGN